MSCANVCTARASTTVHSTEKPRTGFIMDQFAGIVRGCAEILRPYVWHAICFTLLATSSSPSFTTEDSPPTHTYLSTDNLNRLPEIDIGLISN